MESVLHFKVGDKVVDLAGYKGTIRNIVSHKGWHWYEVKFVSGEAVRFDSELMHE